MNSKYEMGPGSKYLIARKSQDESLQREALYHVLGPVFFGHKVAGNPEELDEYYQQLYGVDVKNDFVEGDDHYDDYQEAQCALSDGMSLYGGEIAFQETVLADLAERVWDEMEAKSCRTFRRINTLLEE